jgi:hypothetical protein
LTVKDRGGIRGLYLNPPNKGLIFCVDEKSQMQALDLVCQEWIRVINDYMDNHNQNPRVFVESASVERILERWPNVKRRSTHYTTSAA